MRVAVACATVACAMGAVAWSPIHPARAEGDDFAAAAAAAVEEARAERPTVLGTPPAPADGSPLTVSITSISPEILTSETEVSISGVIGNSSDSAIDPPELTVRMQSNSPVTTNDLSSFLSGESLAGEYVTSQTMAEGIGPQATRPFEIKVPVDQLPLYRGREWGPRGVTVVANPVEHPELSAADRSVLLWNPGTELDALPTRVSALVPWTAGNDPTESASILPIIGTDRDAALKEFAATASTVNRDLISIAGHAGVTVAADPLALTVPHGFAGTDADRPADNPQSTAKAPAQSGDTAQSVADEPGRDVGMTASAAELLKQDIEVAVLPAGDLDLGLVAVTGRHDLMDRLGAADTRQKTLDAIPTLEPDAKARLTTDLVWPSTKTFGLQVVRENPGSVVVAPPQLPFDELSFTPEAVVRVNAESGEFLSDGTGTALLSSNDQLAQLVSWAAPTSQDEFDTRQAIRAVTAIITRELPYEQRTVVVPVARDTPVDRTLSERLGVLLDSPWTTPQSLQAIREQVPTTVERQPVGESAPDGLGGVPGHLDQVGNGLALADDLASSTADPEAILSATRAGAAKAMSVGTVQRNIVGQRTAEFDRTVDSLTRSVKVRPSATINLINKTANFPVTVTNTLTTAITVDVGLRPSDPRLQATDKATVTIQPGSTVSAEIPVRAIGSGDIDVATHVTTPTGTMLDDTQIVHVRMRAGWEDTGTAILAALLVLLFGRGIVKTVRRRKSARQATQEDADG